MEYDYGLELALRQSQLAASAGGDEEEQGSAASSSPTDVMRPGGGLGLVVGLLVEYVTRDASGAVVVS